MTNLLQAMERFRALDSDVTASLVSTFLYVAAHGPCRKKDVQNGLSMGNASASRLLAYLSNHHRLEHKSGLGLIERYSPERDQRIMWVRLTPKGQRFADQLKSDVWFKKA